MKRKVIVPGGMLKEADKVVDGSVADYQIYDIIKSALEWISENPIIPTPDQAAELTNLVPYQDPGNGKIFTVVAVEWQRRMFLAPTPAKEVNTIYGNLYRRADGLLYMYFERSEEKAMESAAGDALEIAVPVTLQSYDDLFPRSEVPGEIKDLVSRQDVDSDELEYLLIEAFRRGKKSK